MSLPSGGTVRGALLALFVASGCAALIYEIVWFQLLQLVIGSSAVSLGVLLGMFMGGMCVGSLLLARMISPAHHPLRVYAMLELGTGIIGLGVLFGMPMVSHLYVAHAGHGMTGILLRGVACAICLLPPTLLMGATLPAISRWVQTTREGVSWMGFFYGGNIAGAVIGSLLAGFYLLRVHDMAVATYFAASLNVAIGVTSWLLARITPAVAPVRDELPRQAIPRSRTPVVYLVIALSGLSALGAEVVWTRILSLMLGGTVYTFSVILAVFLLGLGIGSAVGSVLARSAKPRLLLGCCQLLLTAAVAWSAYMLARSLPYWPIDPSLSSSPWYTFQLDLLRCMWAIFPATCLWGASFPLALAAVAEDGQDAGQLVGGVYAANTLGAIVGAVLFSLVLIAWAGSQNAQRVLVVVSAIAALLALGPMLLVRNATRSRRAARGVGAAALLTAIALAALIARAIPKIPPGLVAHGRYLATTGDAREVLYVGEGMNASVAVTQSGGIRYFHVAGKVEASSDPQDMRLQRMLGHIPALLHARPRRALVVGCGAGVTAGSFLTYPTIERVDICEIEPLIPKVVAHYFTKENYDVVNDRRTRVHYDDARHFVLTSDESFDIITSDPINPWVKGAATLYTKEYFQMCKRHLAPGGLVTQWVPLYESTLDAVKSEIATFFEVFPNGTIWSNDASGRGYDIVLLGGGDADGAAPLAIQVDAIQARLDGPEYRLVKQSLRDVEFHSIVDLLATYGGRASDLAPWLAGAQVNRDRNLRLQYLAGFGMNAYSEAWIYDQMDQYLRFPDDLFVASDMTKQILRTRIEQAKTNK